jgi:MurNAc alpha-1-phosphate uridylyltransferase
MRTLDTALIFAAGRGERLYPLTAHTPKPLLTINQEPLIAYHLKKLQLAGFKNVIINHAYLGGQIRRYVGNGSAFNLVVDYLPEPCGGLETGGTLAFLQESLNLQHEFLFTINGDIYTEKSLSNQCPIQQNINGHLILVPKSEYFTTADFGLDNQQLITSEKKFIFSGMAYYRLSALKQLPIARFSIREWLLQQIQNKHLSGELYCGEWQDIGTPERLASLQTPSLA